MTVIDDYLKKVDQPQKEQLERIRKIVHKTVPEVEETIGYGMPVFKYKHKYLVGMCVFKNHMSLFPGSEAVEILKDKLKGYSLSKGTIQFTPDKPLSEPLIKEILLLRVADISK